MSRKEIEPLWAARVAVCSNASTYRMAADVPLIIPEVNADHLAMIERQRAERGWKGCLITNPNCAAIGIVMALKPLHDAFGVKTVHVATLQAVSGAGYPGVASLDILENIIPNIANGGEEAKIESEPRKLLGSVVDGRVVEAQIGISAQATRVPVIDGHTALLSVAFERKPSVEQAIAALEAFQAPEQVRGLPSAPGAADRRPARGRPAAAAPRPRHRQGHERGDRAGARVPAAGSAAGGAFAQHHSRRGRRGAAERRAAGGDWRRGLAVWASTRHEVVSPTAVWYFSIKVFRFSRLQREKPAHR